MIWEESASGIIIISSSISNFSGIIISGNSSALLVKGSTNLPAIAERAAVSGETRNISAVLVPLLPSKFLLFVRTDTAFVCGDCPFPIQNPQALSIILAPESIRLESIPFLDIIENTCREPGAIATEMSELIFSPSNNLPTIIKSRNEEFVQLPIST